MLATRCNNLGPFQHALQMLEIHQHADIAASVGT
jgi:hypothetical protein